MKPITHNQLTREVQMSLALFSATSNTDPTKIIEGANQTAELIVKTALADQGVDLTNDPLNQETMEVIEELNFNLVNIITGLRIISEIAGKEKKKGANK